MTLRRVLIALALVFLVALGVVAWLLLRGHGSGEAVAPPRGASAQLPDPPLSMILAPVLLELSALEEAMNRSVPEVFVEDAGRELEGGLLLDARVARAGDLSLSVERGALLTTVPVTTDIDVSSPHLKQSMHVDCELKVTARSALSLTDRWGLRSKTALSYTWTKPPVLRVGRVELPVRRLVESRLDDQLARVAERVDQQLTDRDPLRKRLEQLWSNLHQPVALRGGAWLAVQPVSLVAGDLQLRADGIHLDMGLAGRMRLLLGEEPEPAAASALPDRAASKGEPWISLQVPIQLPWATLEKTLGQELVGRTQPIAVPGTDATLDLTVREVGVYPSGEDVVLALGYELDGPSTPLDGRGTLYLSGVPVIDRERQELRMDDLDAAVQTDQTAVQAASWLLSSGGLAALEEKMRVPMADKLAEARANIERGISASDGRPAALDGHLDELALTSVVPTQDALVVMALARGTLSVELSSLPAKGVGKPKAQPASLDLGGGRGGKAGKRGR